MNKISGKFKMKHETKQKQIEHLTYDIIEEIADEIGFKVNSYPEVKWIGNKTLFEDLGINEKYRKYIEDIKKKKRAVYYPRHNIIILATDKKSAIGEEAGHFLHFENSGINLKKHKKNDLDYVSLRSLVEMIGYFCSKLIDPTRKNDYGKHAQRTDYNSNKKSTSANYLESLVFEDNISDEKFMIYQHGYELGEKLYNQYVLGHFTKKGIHSLMTNPLNEKYAPTKEFLWLKQTL